MYHGYRESARGFGKSLRSAHGQHDLALVASAAWHVLAYTVPWLLEHRDRAWLAGALGLAQRLLVNIRRAAALSPKRTVPVTRWRPWGPTRPRRRTTPGRAVAMRPGSRRDGLARVAAPRRARAAAPAGARRPRALGRRAAPAAGGRRVGRPVSGSVSGGPHSWATAWNGIAPSCPISAPSQPRQPQRADPYLSAGVVHTDVPAPAPGALSASSSAPGLVRWPAAFASRRGPARGRLRGGRVVWPGCPARCSTLPCWCALPRAAGPLPASAARSPCGDRCCPAALFRQIDARSPRAGGPPLAASRPDRRRP